MPLIFRRFAVLMLIALLAAFLPQAQPARALTYTVTTTADSGVGSLRLAITNANSNAGPDTIAFNIATTDAGYNATGQYWTIQPASPLPDLSGGGTTIDGATQPIGRTTGPKIVINGDVAGVSNGLKVTSAGNTIANLVINGFNRSGIQGEGGIGVYIVGTGATNNHVIGSWIGLAADGASANSNDDWGVLIDDGASTNTIGGTTAAERNIISGNGRSGTANVAIKQYKANSTNIIHDNSIKGNHIGTTPDGLAKIGGNPGYGVLLGDFAQNNTVGGTTPAERNVIAGHDSGTTIATPGVFVAGDPFNKPNQNNIVIGNYIGVGANGTTAIPNGIGIQINGATGTIIGRDPAAGGDPAAGRNIISGNNTIGVVVEGSGATGTTIVNNWIGLDTAGNALANTNQGVVVRTNATGTTIGPANVISANGSDGVLLSSGSNTVKGNYVGTDVNGTTSKTNGQHSININAGTGNTIGGPSAADRNVIAAKSSQAGIRLQGPTNSNKVYGNYIGVDKTGGVPLILPRPATSTGILILSGSTNNKIGEVNAVGAGNVIGGLDVGIKLQDTGTNNNTIKNNSIGVGAGGQDIGNINYGIHVTGGPTSNTMGGTLGTEGNLVAYNDFYGIYFDGATAGNNIAAGNTVHDTGVSGVRVRAATGVKITQTQTSNNGGPGIELALGGNANLAAPTLQFSTPGGTPTLSGNACNNCVIEIFTSSARDDGEGPRYLTTTSADAGGAFSIAVAGCDRFLTATARDASNNTSPFTNSMIDSVNGCQAAQPDVQLDAAIPAAKTVAPGATATYQHTLHNIGGAPGNFTITNNPPPSGWTVLVSPTSVNSLAPGATATINVSVTPPANAPGGAVAQTTITAAVGNQSDQKTDTTTVQQVYAVAITPNRSGQVTPPGSIDYSHTITNTGNGNDTIGLTATSTNPGVSVTFPDGPSCTLAAGASCTRRAHITVAAGATGADTTTVRATSQGSAAAFAEIQDTTTLVSAAIPSISSATPNPQSILPGNTATFNHTVTNVGNISGQFTVSLPNNAPAGWTFLYTPTTSFTLAPGDTQAVQVTISAKTGANAPNVGSSSTAQVQIQSSDSALATANDTATALLRPAFTFTTATPPTVNNAHPSQTVVFTHTLTNDGNGTDTFNITITPPGGWTASPIAPITLARNASQLVVVRVQVPTGQGAGSYPFDVSAQTASTPQPAAQTRTDTVVVVGAAVPQLSPGQTKAAPSPLPPTLTFTHVLTNTGNQAGTFSLSAAVQGAPAGWSAAPSQPSCSLVQNASCTFTVNVTIPAGASVGDQAIVVTASISGPPPASDSVTDIVKIPAIAGVQFTPNYPAGSGDPGAQVTYVHTLTNTGNGTDSYTITLAPEPGWSSIASPVIVANVPRGATRTVTVTITVPAGVLAGSTGTVTATATSALAPHPTASVVDRTTVNAKPGATLIPDQLTLSANPTGALSDTVTFQHTLRNTGSIAISYTLSTTNNPPRWTTVVTPTQTGPLAPGAQTTVAVRVTVPPGTAFGEVTTTTLRVRQLGGPAVDLATARDTTRVGPLFGALLTPPLNRRSALPGATVVYTHTLRNSGLDEDTFLLSTIAPNGWDTRVAPSSVSLPRNGSTIITVTVQVPTSALSTTLVYPPDLATVRAQSVNDSNGFGTAQEETTVLQVAGVSLSPPRSRTATPGRTISFQHTLLNTGNGLDTFDITWTITGTGVLTWSVTLSPPSDTLLPGDNNPVVMVNVQVPVNAAPDAVGRVIVMATARSDPRVTDRLEDVLIGPARIASGERIYLPIVKR